MESTSRPLAARLKSPIVLLLFATLLAGGVAYVAYLYLQQREERIKEEMAASSARQQTPKVAVVVPREDARIGVVLDPGLFVTRDIDSDLVYPDTVLASDFSKVRGQALARPVLRGRPVRLTDLTVPVVRDVASVLPSGTRAVTIEIDSVNSISQTLRPGHRVDVYLLSSGTARGADAADGPVNQAMLYMQNMTILATGKEFQDVAKGDAERLSKMARPGEIEGQRDKDFDTITLLVTPAEAARLLVGQKLGSFRVALRGVNDDQAVAMRPLTGADVMPRAGVAGPRGGVEFIVGGKSAGDATLASTLVSMGLPPAAMRAGGAAVPGAQTPAAGGSQAATAAQADMTAATVDDVIKRMTAPRTSIGGEAREARSSSSQTMSTAAPR